MTAITETDKAYLAGLIDGEGCIVITKSVYERTPTPIYSLAVVVSSCDGDVLRYWAEKTGCGKVRTGALEHGNSRKSYVWWVSSRQAESLLRCVYPYLMLKREQADIAFKFTETIAPVGGWGQRGGTRGGNRTPPDVIHQRERYKQALSKMKGYKVRRGRPMKQEVAA